MYTYSPFAAFLDFTRSIDGFSGFVEFYDAPTQYTPQCAENILESVNKMEN